MTNLHESFDQYIHFLLVILGSGMKGNLEWPLCRSVE